MKNLITNAIWAFCLLSFVRNPFAQAPSFEKLNPFENIEFLGKPTQNITLTVDFDKAIGELSNDNISVISIITEHTGESLRKFKYAIGFKIPGYSQRFYVPCKDRSAYKKLVLRQQTIKKLKLDCVVYRFYHLDVASNFFVVNKVTILD